MAQAEPPLKREADRVKRLLQVLEGASRLLILLQDSPDPDAVASAAALRHLVLARQRTEVVIAYGGIVGRAENRALLRALGLEIVHVRQVDFSDYDRIALVDTQPGTGNNSLPAGTPVHVVIDHHPPTEAVREASFADIRPNLGAATTILYRYLKAARLALPDDLAVAMLYGIRSDTMELGRQATRADTAAYLALYPRVDKRLLAGIAHADLPPLYFQLLATALERAEVTGQVVVSSLGDMNNPDMIGEVADLLLRLEGARWVLCYGFFERRLLASVRTDDPRGDAHAVTCRLVERLRRRPPAAPTGRDREDEAGAGNGDRRVSGGGHRVMAGLQASVVEDTVAERERLAGEVVGAFRAVLGVADRTPRRLLELASTTSVATTLDEA